MPTEAALVLHRNGALGARTYDSALDVARRLALKPIEALVLAEVFRPAEAAALLGAFALVPVWRSWPTVSLGADMRALIPGDVAVEHRVIPIRLSAERDLVLAMVDPLDEAACAEVAFFADARLERVAVPATMASNAIAAFYGAVTPFLSLWRVREERSSDEYTNHPARDSRRRPR